MRNIEYAIIGGGFAGLHCAVKLANAGFQVVVLERDSELMTEASRHNFSRLHHCWHYPGSQETALECLPHAFEFLQEFGDVLLRSKPENPLPFQNGWCALAHQSYTSRSDWLSMAEVMYGSYQQELKKYEQNFGPAEEFFRLLPQHEWEGLINPDRTQLVASTLEPFVDLEALAAKVIHAARSHCQGRCNHGSCKSLVKVIPEGRRKVNILNFLSSKQQWSI